VTIKEPGGQHMGGRRFRARGDWRERAHAPGYQNDYCGPPFRSA